MADRVIIGYWDCRGLVHPIILVLEYLKKPYTFVPPSKDLIGPPPNYHKNKWFEAKSKILADYDFPNLPYYHDPDLDLKLTQSSAIIMHLARTNDLWSPDQDEAGLANADVLREEIKDFVQLTVDLCYDPEAPMDQIKIETYKQNAHKRMDLLEKKLTKSNSKWFMGAKLTYLDFLVYDVLDQQRLLFPGLVLLGPCQRLRNFMADFEALPTVSVFLASPRYRPFPLWSERSHLGRSSLNIIN